MSNTMPGKLYKTLSIVQGLYTLLTALWPLIDINSFMEVTGPKTDIWLVKTVAVLLVPIGLCYLAGGALKSESLIVIMLGMTSSAGLACIDLYYTGKGDISWIYQLDGYLEILFCLLWIYIALGEFKKHRHTLLHH